MMFLFWAMRKRRVVRLNEGGVYHCVSRVAGAYHLFEDGDKEVFRKQLFQIADFCGLEVLSYCVMSNHFHVMFRVPTVEDEDVSDEELVRRFSVLYPTTTAYQKKSAEMIAAELKQGGSIREDLRRNLLSRMHGLPHFMKALKQRFTLWYNRTHGRVGTLWSERYKSVLVQDKDNALKMVAAYIDLNPVRARICEDPKDYRFSGYGSACGGSGIGKLGICKILHMDNKYAELAMQEYRKYLFALGSVSDRSKQYSTGKISESKAEEVMASGGKLSWRESALCHIRYFRDGVVLGEGAWVQSIMEACPEVFGKDRKTGFSRMKGEFNREGLCVARNLQRKVIYKIS